MSTENIPGMILPKQIGMLSGNPRDSAIAEMKQSSAIQSQANKAMAGGKYKKNIINIANIVNIKNMVVVIILLLFLNLICLINLLEHQGQTQMIKFLEIYKHLHKVVLGLLVII